METSIDQCPLCESKKQTYLYKDFEGSHYVGCERAAGALQYTVALCSAAAPQSYVFYANFTAMVYYMRPSEEEHLADEGALAPRA